MGIVQSFHSIIQDRVTHTVVRSLHTSQKLQKFLFTESKKIAGVLVATLLMSSLHGSLSANLDLNSSLQGSGTLHMGWYTKPAPMDPFNTVDTITVPLMELVFNKLVRFNSRGEFEGDLAQRWEISDDGLTYTFYLRRGVKFHDGTECTSKDVLKTFQLISDQETSPTFWRHFEMVREWRAPSDFIFEGQLKEPFSPFMLSLWRAKIVPEHRLRGGKKDLASFIQHPVGTGPFVYLEQEPSGDMHFKAYEDYFEGRPHLDEVAVKIFGDQSQLWSAFLRGEIDLITYLDRKNYQEIKNDPSFHIFRALSMSGYALMFNLKDEFLSEETIRKAIAYGINSEELVDHLEEGDGVLISGPFHPNSWAYDQAVKPQAYEPKKAMALLASDGFIQRDGIFERQGKKLFLNLLVDAKNDHLYRMAKLIRQQLQEVGIGISIKVFSNYQELSKKIYQNEASFQGYLFIFNTGLDPDIPATYWESSMPKPFNFGNYRNSEVDALFQVARKTQNQTDRARAYRQIHRIIARERPAVFLYMPYIFHAVSNELINAEPLLSAPFIPFYLLKDVSKVEVKERR